MTTRIPLDLKSEESCFFVYQGSGNMAGNRPAQASSSLPKGSTKSRNPESGIRKPAPGNQNYNNNNISLDKSPLVHGIVQ